jgi:hypothetical protein
MEPSPTYVTEGQMAAYLNAIRAPTLTVTGTTGWPWSAGLMLARLSSVRAVEHHHLIGGHHLHLDDATGPAVAEVVRDFLHRHQPHAAAMADRIAAHTHHRRQPHPTFASVGAAAAPGAAIPVVTPPTQQGETPVLYPGPVAPLTPSGHGGHRGSSGGGGGMNAHSITDSGAVDEAAAAAAATIADVGVAGRAVGAGAAGGSVSTAADRTRAWSKHHLLVAHTQPATPTALAAAGAALPAPAGVSWMHAFSQVLHIDKAAPHGTWATPYRWAFGRAAATSGAPHAPAGAGAGTELVWVEVGDAASGIATGQLAPQLASRGVSVSVGAYAPRVWLETMPTLEAFLAAAAPAPADAKDAGKPHAVSGGRAALEAKGDAY